MNTSPLQFGNAYRLTFSTANDTAYKKKHSDITGDLFDKIRALPKYGFNTERYDAMSGLLLTKKCQIAVVLDDKFNENHPSRGALNIFTDKDAEEVFDLFKPNPSEREKEKARKILSGMIPNISQDEFEQAQQTISSHITSEDRKEGLQSLSKKIHAENQFALSTRTTRNNDITLEDFVSQKLTSHLNLNA